MSALLIITSIRVTEKAKDYVEKRLHLVVRQGFASPSLDCEQKKSPPHGDLSHISAMAHRLKMLELALKDSDWIGYDGKFIDVADWLHQ